MFDPPLRLDLFRTMLPMRGFSHAAARRSEAQAIIVRLRTRAGRDGWGEALPRDYVTGETFDTVPRDIAQHLWPRLKTCRTPEDLSQALHELPSTDPDARPITAARAAVELAVFGAYRLSLPGEPVPTDRWPSVSGVIGSESPRQTARKLRHMRWFGLRHFKLKLGMGDTLDAANLQTVYHQLAKGLAAGRYSLRVDVNGAWPLREVPARVAQLERFGVCAVEQPCPARPYEMVEIAMDCSLPLIADESLITEADAEVLLGGEGRVWLNVRLGKNGGLGPSLRLARLAERDGVPYILGCMVGESGILSLAQRAMLSVAPPPVMLEGNYGVWLLRDDLVRPSPRMGYGGRIPPGPWHRLAPGVDGRALRKYGTYVGTLS